ncbi:hypothetical protein [Winogradskyella alexanderae]|uniref:Adhesin domain-containing protein n=1 Tax=Winogradskyella alexanderae TaxID=2877123 RepID=A0ABS7XNS0_9FLAO|nr:hypothetical protein [Winogradskyella alexanderae]MCA0131637.1 hypothetical protein [Winogradskyella alexanderae]
MKTLIQFKLIAILFMLPTLVMGNSISEIAKSTREKQIKKSFNVNANSTLKINNSYGNIDIVTWDENRIEFDIIIKVTGNNPDKVEDRLEDIDVKFSTSSGWVAAETQFGKKSKSWWNWGNNNRLKVEVNYRVKVPITNNVILDNDYGSINVDKLEGRATINCDYGKVTTQELMAKDNVLNFDYTNNSYFEYINGGKITADYSSFTVGKTKNLELNADYTKSIIEISENIKYNCDYGSLKVDNVNNIEGNADYLTLRLGNVFKNADLKADYGAIKIDRLASNANNVNINTEFVGVTIGYDPGYSFDFDIDLEYASLKGDEEFNFTNKKIDGSEKYFSGYSGKDNSGNLINIEAEYGSITFKKL